MICLRQTERGHAGGPSDGFTAWAQLNDGNVICEWCWGALKAREVRGRSWVVSLDGVTWFTAENKQQRIQVLVEPPAPPFAIYYTAGRQKQGWIAYRGSVAESRDVFPVAVDWLTHVVMMDRCWVREAAPLLLALRERNVSKTALASGEYPGGVWMRAYMEGWRDDLVSAARRAGDPRWEVLCFAVP